MSATRRHFLITTAASIAGAPAFAVRGRAQHWQESQRYPDARIEILDPSFAPYRINSAKVERLATEIEDLRRQFEQFRKQFE